MVVARIEVLLDRVRELLDIRTAGIVPHTCSTLRWHTYGAMATLTPSEIRPNPQEKL